MWLLHARHHGTCFVLYIDRSQSLACKSKIQKALKTEKYFIIHLAAKPGLRESETVIVFVIPLTVLDHMIYCNLGLHLNTFAVGVLPRAHRKYYIIYGMCAVLPS